MHQQDQPRGTLLRILGAGFGIAVTIGATIGGTILITPAQVATQLPHPLLYLSAWLAGGIYALLCAVSFAELGTLLPRSGGLYVFTHRALGDYAGFVVGWTDWLQSCGTIGTAALLAGQVAAGLAAPLGGRATWVSLGLVTAFGLLQWAGIRWGSRAQEVASLLKVLAVVGLGTAAFALGGSLPGAASHPASVPAGLSLLTGAVLALQVVIYVYDGYYGVVYFGEELRVPERDVPRSIFGSVWLTIGIYLFVNLAYLYALPLPAMAAADSVGGAVARVLFGQAGHALIGAMTLVILAGSINAYYLSGPRILLAMSRDGLFSRRATQVNRRGTPTVTLFMSLLASTLFVLSGTFQKAIAVLTFLIVANYVLTFLSVLVLRRREPELPRPYRARAYPWTTALALASAAAFLAASVAGDTRNSAYALAALAASYPAFLLVRRLQAASVAPPQAGGV
ncbi:MAG: APC family permease [Candidatus Latescibacterota bacterium]